MQYDELKIDHNSDNEDAFDLTITSLKLMIFGNSTKNPIPINANFITSPNSISTTITDSEKQNLTNLNHPKNQTQDQNLNLTLNLN